MRTNRPPINGQVLLKARMRKGLTQEAVQAECARRGQPVYNLSRWENGRTRWPSPPALKLVTDVLGLELEAVFQQPAAA
jgi:transcriptional regulator with XRE-family HTH domain